MYVALRQSQYISIVIFECPSTLEKEVNFFFAHFVADAPESDKNDLLSELEVMKTLKPHPHVIKLLGCVTESGKVLTKILILSYC